MTLPAYAMSQASFPEIYERLIVPPLFRPWAEAMLDRAQVGGRDRLLDIACGTGIVARLANDRLQGGCVVGVDVSPPMLAVARSIAPDIDWREGNAGALPVQEGETFDVVTCHQGFQFFPDKPAAAREMRRVLAPGGRLAISIWRALEDNPLFQDLHAVAVRHLGPFVDSRHGYGNPDALASVLADAGFRDIQVERMSRPVRLTGPEVFVRLNAMALVGMSPAAKGMDEAQRNQVVGTIAAESNGVLPRYVEGNELVFELTTNMGTARG